MYGCTLWCLLQIEHLARLLHVYCYGKDEGLLQVPLGIKLHTLFHNHCRMVETRVSTAYKDDQRVENSMKKGKSHLSRCSNNVNEKNVRSIITWMNTEGVLSYDKTQTRKFV